MQHFGLYQHACLPVFSLYGCFPADRFLVGSGFFGCHSLGLEGKRDVFCIFCVTVLHLDKKNPF